MATRVCMAAPLRPAAVLRRLSILGSYNRQPIMTPDGGTVALDWWMGCDKHAFAPPDTPIFLVLHGINGG